MYVYGACGSYAHTSCFCFLIHIVTNMCFPVCISGYIYVQKSILTYEMSTRYV